MARLSRELVTIHCDVPVTVELDALRAGEPDYPALVRISTELEFASLARKFAQAGEGTGAPLPAAVDGAASAAAGAPDPARGAVDVTVVCNVEEVPGLVERLRCRRR